MSKKVKKSDEIDAALAAAGVEIEDTGPETHVAETPVVVGEEFDGPDVKLPTPKEPRVRSARASKIYSLSTGILPEAAKKPLGVHAIVITEAIAVLIAEGRTSASRDEIMAKANELGLYTKKPSVQGVESIFSWWRKSLTGLGWISQGEIVEKPAASADAPASVDAPAPEAALESAEQTA